MDGWVVDVACIWNTAPQRLPSINQRTKFNTNHQRQAQAPCVLLHAVEYRVVEEMDRATTRLNKSKAVRRRLRLDTHVCVK